MAHFLKTEGVKIKFWNLENPKKAYFADFQDQFCFELDCSFGNWDLHL